MSANINMNINVDSIADALRVGRGRHKTDLTENDLLGGRRGGKMNTYDRALADYRGLRRNFALDDCLVSCDSTLMIGDKVIAPSAKPIPEGLDPIKIIVNGPATIVFWEDGTKTVVKCAKGEEWDIYNAFTAALAIKVFGSNSKIKKILKTKVEWPVARVLIAEKEE